MEKSLKSLVREHGFAFKKAYGQNFLTDRALLDQIVEKAGITENDTVLEIGPGAGALTVSIARKAKRVVCYEIDKNLKPLLDEVVGEFNNVEIVYQDVMKANLEEIEKKLGGNYVLVANLPYYITTPIVMRFLEQSTKIRALVIMVQEEVAERFASNPGSSEYGAITVGINLRGSASVVIKVPREMFMPAPNVDSAVVKIIVDNDKFSGVDLKKVRDVVRIAFSSRRKMLVNNLMNGYKMPRGQAEKILIDADIPLTVRGEDLSANDFVKLSELIYDKEKQSG